MQLLYRLSYAARYRTVLIVFLFTARAFISGGFQASYVYTPEVCSLYYNIFTYIMHWQSTCCINTQIYAVSGKM